MRVNFDISNHGPIHIQDFVDYVAAGVEGLGLPFGISTALAPDAVNVVLDNFADPRVAATIERACSMFPDMPLLVIATEVMQDGVFNSGGWTPGVPDTSTYSRMDGWRQRTAGFRRIAPLADAVLCPSERLHDSYLEHLISDRLHYLPLVHLERFASYRPERSGMCDVDEDIDFLFTGVLTDRRRLLLETLTGRGFTVRQLPVGAPEYVRHHYMRRAKVYLAPKHFEATRTLSKMRAYWALCHGYFCMVEAGTDPTDLDAYLQWFSTIDELADAVAMARETRHARAAEQLTRFRAAPAANPFAAPLAAWLQGTTAVGG